MIFSLRQIADINQRDLGINGRFYEDVEGYIYIGKGTRLFKYAKCSEVSLDQTQVPGQTVCDGLDFLDDKIDDLQASTAQGFVDAKCLSIAMAIAL